MSDSRVNLMTAPQVQEFLRKVFPQLGERFDVDEVGPYRATLSLEATQAQLRPGGTVSGPTLFALADLAFYVATLVMIGPEALTVTTNASINFMRKPRPGRLRGEARVLKLGKTLSVGDVTIYSEGLDDPVAHASVTYSIPPRAS